MASRLRYAVSVTPIYTHAAGEGVTTDVIAADYNKTFSGSAEVTGPAYSLSGTAATTTTNCTTGTALFGGALSGAKGIFIRNTGLTDAGVVSAATAAVIWSAATQFTIEPGGAVFLPNPGNLTITCTSSSGTLAVEWAYFK